MFDGEHVQTEPSQIRRRHNTVDAVSDRPLRWPVDRAAEVADPISGSGKVVCRFGHDGSNGRLEHTQQEHVLQQWVTIPGAAHRQSARVRGLEDPEAIAADSPVGGDASPSATTIAEHSAGICVEE